MKPRLWITRFSILRHEVIESVDNAKAKVEAHKEAVDKAAMEAYILDCLDYAEACQELAFAWALEAEYATNDALEVIDEYSAKYGKEV